MTNDAEAAGGERPQEPVRDGATAPHKDARPGAQPGPGVMPVIAERSSPAVFDPTFDVDDIALDTLLDAARWAPSAGNSQPYRYLVGWRRGEEWDAAFTTIVSTLTRGNLRWAPAASVLVVSFVQVETLPGAKKEFIFGATAAHDLGQATAYLTLQAQAMGLAAHQFAGFDQDALAQAVGLEPQWRPMAGIAIGRAWPEAERDGAAPAVTALTQRVDGYDLAGNIEREQKPRRRRSIDEMLWPYPPR